MDFYEASRNVTITAEGPLESLFESPIQDNDYNNAAAYRDQDEVG